MSIRKITKYFITYLTIILFLLLGLCTNQYTYCNEISNQTTDVYITKDTIGNYFDYTLQNSMLTLKKYTGNTNITNLFIDIEFEKIKIDDECFKDLNKLQTIDCINSIPQYVELGNKCFFNCSNLESIFKIKNSNDSQDRLNITKIGNHNFDGCYNLNINFMFNNCTIGPDTFCNINSNNYFILKNCTIENYAFHDITNLNENKNLDRLKLHIINTTIKDKAFYNCKNIGSINFTNCYGIGNEAFSGCEGAELLFNPINTTDPDYKTMNIGSKAFSGVSHIGLPNVMLTNFLPYNTDQIAVDALYGFDSSEPTYSLSPNDYSSILKLLKLPSNYHGFIPSWNSSYCIVGYGGDLNDITFPNNIDDHKLVFFDRLLYNPDNKNYGNITLPNDMTDIPTDLFCDQTIMGSINLDNITKINRASFNNTTGLYNAIDTGTKLFSPVIVDDYGFLKSSIPMDKIDFSKLEEIGSCAFNECSLSGDITLPNVKNIKYGAFKCNDNLKVYIDNPNTIIHMPISDYPIYIPYNFNLDNLKADESSNNVYKGILGKDYIFTGIVPVSVDINGKSQNLSYNLDTKKTIEPLKISGYDVKLVDDNGNTYLDDLSDYTYVGGNNINEIHFTAKLTASQYNDDNVSTSDSNLFNNLLLILSMLCFSLITIACILYKNTKMHQTLK